MLTTWLHELGEILYFRDNPDLDDIVILDPQWVTESISQVLESEKVVRGLGIFTRDHMREVWRELDPPVQDHFLRLMEQFDLSYRTLGNEDVSIVVERLDENPAHYETAWDEVAARPSAKNISMTFELDGRRPPGIPTWFIARQHRFTTRTHWRYGGLFADDRKKRTHLGLLETSPTGNRIRLTVRGPYPHNFFALLRDGFELTLGRFKGLGVMRKIPCPGPNSAGCSHEFALEHLQRRLDRHPPKLTIECPVCDEDVEVTRLLYGIDPRSQIRVLEAIRAVHEDVGAVSEDIGTLREELGELRTFAQREFLNAYKREQADVDQRCPNVFVVEPDPSVAQIQTLFSHSEAGMGEQLLGWVRKPMVLQFLCQQPGHWHPTYKAGRYPLKKPRPWLRATLPFVRHLYSVLQHAAPVVGPAAGIAASVWEKTFRNHLKLMGELVKLSDLGDVDKTGDEIEELADVGRPSDGPSLLPLRRLLDDIDPDREQLGLKRLVTPEGHILWLCDDHYAEYR